jgi:hypothetical protein
MLEISQKSILKLFHSESIQVHNVKQLAPPQHNHGCFKQKNMYVHNENENFRIQVGKPCLTSFSSDKNGLQQMINETL